MSCRGISETFLQDLESGPLSPLLALVRLDDTLSLCIRDGQVHVYYRGGRLLKITSLGRGGYTPRFDWNFLKPLPASLDCFRPDEKGLKEVKVISTPDHLRPWISQIPLIKASMDIWFSENPKLEREFQQSIERVNNCKVDTDYYIVDIEYTNTNHRDVRADMLALRWPRSRAARSSKSGFAPRLTLVEWKYGDGALTGEDGIVGHINTMVAAYREKRLDFEALAKETLTVFEQRVRLGLIRCGGMEEQFRQMSRVADGPPDYLILIADHDPDQKPLKQELSKVAAMSDLPFSVKVATASPMGYGLFFQHVQDIESALAAL